MKNNQTIKVFKPILVLIIAVFISGTIIAQTDAKADSTKQETPDQEKKEKKKRDSFKVYGGVNFNGLNVPSNVYESKTGLGFLIGASYKRGKFFYWEIGARYSGNLYDLAILGLPNDSTGNTFGVRAIDLPITGGINLTSFVDRLVGVRIFISAVPSFAIGVSDNDLGISKDDINSFNLLAQAGVGIDIAFIFLEAGANLGFSDLLENDIQSNPYQGFVTLGFRF